MMTSLKKEWEGYVFMQCETDPSRSKIRYISIHSGNLVCYQTIKDKSHEALQKIRFHPLWSIRLYGVHVQRFLYGSVSIQYKDRTNVFQAMDKYCDNELLNAMNYWKENLECNHFKRNSSLKSSTKWNRSQDQECGDLLKNTPKMHSPRFVSFGL
uniref:Uncharacterized protein n=1 Tax=Timspurckia oligopyrenoides TaxID=708627 RepID=A0A7S0ZKE2_9RHOD|mmetsp:Transcript_8692/g.15712  ORF Transcript_8692/g.15712 Transcript_8692/m.15712 type:complete len:155 (+) Transcript_8692:281-745(+)